MPHPGETPTLPPPPPKPARRRPIVTRSHAAPALTAKRARVPDRVEPPTDLPQISALALTPVPTTTVHDVQTFAVTTCAEAQLHASAVFDLPGLVLPSGLDDHTQRLASALGDHHDAARQAIIDCELSLRALGSIVRATIARSQLHPAGRPAAHPFETLRIAITTLAATMPLVTAPIASAQLSIALPGMAERAERDGAALVRAAAAAKGVSRLGTYPNRARGLDAVESAFGEAIAAWTVPLSTGESALSSLAGSLSVDLTALLAMSVQLAGRSGIFWAHHRHVRPPAPWPH